MFAVSNSLILFPTEQVVFNLFMTVQHWAVSKECNGLIFERPNLEVFWSCQTQPGNDLLSTCSCFFLPPFISGDSGVSRVFLHFDLLVFLWSFMRSCWCCRMVSQWKRDLWFYVSLDGLESLTCLFETVAAPSSGRGFLYLCILTLRDLV